MQAYLSGVTEAWERGGWLELSLFFPAQRKALKKHPAFSIVSTSAAGMMVNVDTDALAVSFEYEVSLALTKDSPFRQERFFFDVLVDGKYIAQIGQTEMRAPFFQGGLEVDLPQGMKQLCIHFPNLFSVKMRNLQFQGASLVQRHKHACRLLVLGHSLMQGYIMDAPSEALANRLSTRMDLEILNQALGGSSFNTLLPMKNAAGQPDAVLVSFGVNEWWRRLDNARQIILNYMTGS